MGDVSKTSLSGVKDMTVMATHVQYIRVNNWRFATELTTLKIMALNCLSREFNLLKALYILSYVDIHYKV